MVAMIARRSLGRTASRSLRTNRPQQTRGFAAATSGSFTYETGDVGGVKLASRDIPGPTTTVAVVARAGTRFQPLPGLTEGLEKFVFKNTERRSALRITREAELLGGELITWHSRENLVIGAKFLRDDLPYFTELLGEIITKTKYTTHEYEEEVLPKIKLAQKQNLADVHQLAFNSAHGIAFHRGLGTPLHPTSSSPVTKYLGPEAIWSYSQSAYSASNIALVANGAEHSELTKWTREFFADVHKGGAAISPEQSKYYGGEERIAHDGGNAVVLAFPGSSSFTGGFWKPEISVLAALLGGESSIKWSPGFSLLAKAAEAHPGVTVSTTNHAYSDAGLLCVSLTGKAEAIRAAGKEVVNTIKKVSSGDIKKEELQKAIATAKFRILAAGHEAAAGIEATGAGIIGGGKAYQFEEVAKSIESVNESKVKSVAKTLLEGKATISSVGDLYVLPFAEELGLHV